MIPTVRSTRLYDLGRHYSAAITNDSKTFDKRIQMPAKKLPQPPRWEKWLYAMVIQMLEDGKGRDEICMDTGLEIHAFDEFKTHIHEITGAKVTPVTRPGRAGGNKGKTGRPGSMTQEQIDATLLLSSDGWSDAKISRVLGVKLTSVEYYRRLV